MNLGKELCVEAAAPAMATIHAITPKLTVAIAKGSPMKFEILKPIGSRDDDTKGHGDFKDFEGYQNDGRNSGSLDLCIPRYHREGWAKQGFQDLREEKMYRKFTIVFQ